MFTPWYIGHILLVVLGCILPHIIGSLLSMFYRQGFSFIDGNGLLDHRSLVQLCRPIPRCAYSLVHWAYILVVLGCILPHIIGSLLSMFYRQGFSFIDGNVLLDHRSLVQLCRPILWVGGIHWLFN